VVPQDHGSHPGPAMRLATWSSSDAVAVRRLSMTMCGAAGLESSRMRAANAAKSASLAVSRPDPRAVSRSRKVAVSDQTQTRRTAPPPSSATHDRHRSASWICLVRSAGRVPAPGRGPGRTGTPAGSRRALLPGRGEPGPVRGVPVCVMGVEQGQEPGVGGGELRQAASAAPVGSASAVLLRLVLLKDVPSVTPSVVRIPTTSLRMSLA